MPLCVLILIAAFAWLGHAEVQLWGRAPADALDRYAPDRIRAMATLPPRVEEAALWTLCPGEILRTRSRLAQCLAEDRGLIPQFSRAEQWQEVIEAQIRFAAEVNSLADAEMVMREVKALREFRRKLAEEAGGPVVAVLKRLGLMEKPSSTARKPTDAEILQAMAATRLHAELTRARFEALPLASNDLSAERKRTVELGLMASGRVIVYDNARAQPRPVLAVDRQSLAHQIEVSRRAAPRAGHVLEGHLARYLAMMLATTVLAMLMLRLAGISLWTFTVLMTVGTYGGLVLLDFAVTGPESLRHLSVRNFGEGTWTIAGTLWVPPLVGACAAWLCVIVQRLDAVHYAFDRLLRWPLGVWAGLISCAGLALLMAPAGAAKAEALIALTVFCTGTLIARYAPTINTGAGGWAMAKFAAPLIVAGIAATTMANAGRPDLGGLLVVVAAGLISMAITARAPLTRLVLFFAVIAAGFVYWEFLSGNDMLGLEHRVPEHVRSRLLVAREPALHGEPDVFLITALMRSAGLDGWGWARVPWTGLAGVTGLPPSTASDLGFGLAAAISGLAGAYTVVLFLAGLLAWLVACGFGVAFGARASATRRFIAGFGAFGVLTQLLRLFITLGGSTSVIPLSGVPLPLLSHSPTATAALFVYVGCLMATQTTKGEQPC